MSGNETTPKETQTASANTTATELVQLGALGLQGLAAVLYPNDTKDEQAFQQHVQDLYQMNRDVLLNDTAFIVGTLVKIPKL